MFLFILESFCSLQLHDYSPATFPWVVNVWRDHFAIDSMASKPLTWCPYKRHRSQKSSKINKNHKYLSSLLLLPLSYTDLLQKFHEISYCAISRKDSVYVSRGSLVAGSRSPKIPGNCDAEIMQCLFSCLRLHTFVYICLLHTYYYIIPKIQKK